MCMYVCALNFNSKSIDSNSFSETDASTTKESHTRGNWYLEYSNQRNTIKCIFKC